MYKQIDLTQTGGLFVYQDTLAYLQSAYSDLFDAMAVMFGDNVILSGLIVSGGSISAGWVSYNGELIPVAGGSLLNYVHLNTPDDPEQYADGTTNNIYTHKNFVFSASASGNVLWSTFKRLPYNSATLYDALNNIKSILQKAINLEAAVILSGLTTSNNTGSSSGTVDIAAGVSLMNGELVNVNASPTQTWPCWLKTDGTYVTSDPGGTNIKFDYETSQRYRHVLKRQTHESGEVVISNSAADLALFDAATGLGKWKWKGWQIDADSRSRFLVGYDNRTSNPGGADANAWNSEYNTLGNKQGSNTVMLAVNNIPELPVDARYELNGTDGTANGHPLYNGDTESNGSGHDTTSIIANKDVTQAAVDKRPARNVKLFIERI